MPELPEVEILMRHLAPLVTGKTIRSVAVRRRRVIRPLTPVELGQRLRGARVIRVWRRAKYLVFELRHAHPIQSFELLGHLGMTGRMYLAPKRAPLPKHAAVVLDFERERLVFEDPRYFGRMNLDTSVLAGLGPEPLGPDFNTDYLARALKRSSQAIKVKLLDQKLVGGVGNIYASEALHRARLSPKRAARSLKRAELTLLAVAIRSVLAQAIRFGSTVPLHLSGSGGNGFFYYGRAEGTLDVFEQRLRVYDRAGQRCRRCSGVIRRAVQAARSTYYCPGCQR